MTTRAALAAALVLLACGGEPARVRLPNIVLVVGDDLAYADHGFMGSPVVQTPHLDALARSGTVFSHGYNTSSTCRPSLRTLLTGLNPIQLERMTALRRRAGERLMEPGQLRGLATLPRVLAERGYVSFQAGKYWEADYGAAGFSAGMQQPGNDPAHGGVGRALARDGSLDPVVRFLDAPRDGPFFLWFAPMLPHRPHDAEDRFADPYRERGFSWTALWYYANVTRFDAVVGELLALLDERRLRDDTLVVYLTDNGWDQRPEADQSGSFADGPRGKKTMHEIGWRTPIVFSWPGVVPGAGVSDALVSTVDLFPTLLDYAGAPVPAGRPGHSLRPALEQGAAWPRTLVIGSLRGSRVDPGSAAERTSENYDDHRAYLLRNESWWYIWFRDRGAGELYDAEADPRAERNMASRHPRLTERFRGVIEGWEERMEASAVGLAADAH